MFICLHLPYLKDSLIVRIARCSRTFQNNRVVSSKTTDSYEKLWKIDFYFPVKQNFVFMQALVCNLLLISKYMIERDRSIELANLRCSTRQFPLILCRFIITIQEYCKSETTTLHRTSSFPLLNFNGLLKVTVRKEDIFKFISHGTTSKTNKIILKV